MFVVYVQKGKILLKKNFLEYKFDNLNIRGGEKLEGRGRRKIVTDWERRKIRGKGESIERKKNCEVV